MFSAWVKLPFEAFARSRIDYLHPFTVTILLRFGETLFVKNSDLPGETTEITLAKLLDRGAILRRSNAGTGALLAKNRQKSRCSYLYRHLQPGNRVHEIYPGKTRPLIPS